MAFNLNNGNQYAHPDNSILRGYTYREKYQCSRLSWLSVNCSSYLDIQTYNINSAQLKEGFQSR